jgi:hypothetical protein
MLSIKDRKFAHTFVWFFYLFIYARVSRDFFIQNGGKYMQMEIIKNPDESKIVIYKAARIVYAETFPSTLPVVEAFVSMIGNIMTQTKRDLVDVISDETIFPSLNKKSPRHEYINVDAKNNRALQMCVRVVERMMHGGLPDMCFGATRFHHVDELPDWAMSRGYIADIDGVLFYL